MEKNALMQAARLLVNELLETKKDELFVITDDTLSDSSVTQAIMEAAQETEAKVMIVRIPAPRGVAAEANADIPVDALSALLAQADVWIELNARWLLYSAPYYFAKKNNDKLRHMCLTGTGAETLINCVGKIDYPVMRRFSEKMRDKIAAAKEVRMVSPCGDEVRFRNVPGRPMSCKLGQANVPGTHLFVGQIGWTPEIESVNGTICIDGSIAPDIGIVDEPIHIEVKNGSVISVHGGESAQKYDTWLRKFEHPQMLRIAHAGVGFNPGAKIVGDILQDQRVWGSATWGFGSISAAMMPPNGAEAPSHSDAVSLCVSIYLDGRPLWEDGKLVDTELLPDGMLLKAEQ